MVDYSKWKNIEASSKDPEIQFYRCEQKDGCKERIHVKDEEVVAIINFHSHEPTPAKIEVQHCITKIRDRAVSTFEATSQLINGGTQDLSQACQAVLPNQQALQKFVRRARKEVEAPHTLPTSLRELKIRDHAVSTLKATSQIINWGTQDLSQVSQAALLNQQAPQKIVRRARKEVEAPPTFPHRYESLLYQISDDEDETHPNIDTPSLFRWRHQARVERMEERKKEAEVIEKKKDEINKLLSEAKLKLENALKENLPNIEQLKNEVAECEDKLKKTKQEEEAFNKKEKLAPWNVDTISKPGFAKTVINKKPAYNKEEVLSEEEREARMKKFIKDHEKELKHFGMLRRYDDSKVYLKEHNYLVCDDTANYLVIWCINLEMEEKHDLMAHVAHQTICMQYILELAKQLDTDPRACVDAFFSKIQIAEAEYKASFQDELNQFKIRIKKRAAEKLEEAIKEAEEEEKQKRLGPGGLDPVEVFESLPEELQKCFEVQDIPLLQETIAKMDEEEAKYHMKRCVESGLWVPDGAKKQETENSSQETSSST